MKRTRLTVMLLAPLMLVFVHDWLQPREREITTLAAIGVIEQYRAHISPRLRGRIVCRFEPTCSEYGLVSVKKHGAMVGGAKGAWRILRCGPWTPAGTVDAP